MTYYFYDLETTGLSASRDRIIQFAGQRLDDKLRPVAQVDQYLVKLSLDVIPKPAAILTHRILPLVCRFRWFNRGRIVAGA